MDYTKIDTGRWLVAMGRLLVCGLVTFSVAWTSSYSILHYILKREKASAAALAVTISIVFLVLFTSSVSQRKTGWFSYYPSADHDQQM